MTLTPRGNLVAFLERVIPDGPEGDRIKGIILGLADEYADEREAAGIEAHARGPLRTEPQDWNRRPA